MIVCQKGTMPNSCMPKGNKPKDSMPKYRGAFFPSQTFQCDVLSALFVHNLIYKCHISMGFLHEPI